MGCVTFPACSAPQCGRARQLFPGPCGGSGDCSQLAPWCLALALTLLGPADGPSGVTAAHLPTSVRRTALGIFRQEVGCQDYLSSVIPQASSQIREPESCLALPDHLAGGRCAAVAQGWAVSEDSVRAAQCLSSLLGLGANALGRRGQCGTCDLRGPGPSHCSWEADVTWNPGVSWAWSAHSVSLMELGPSCEALQLRLL